MITVRRPRRIVTALLATAALWLMPAAAIAGTWTPPSPDPGTPQSFVDEVNALGLLQDTPSAWQPTGTVVASTGFDPQVYGFSFLNYTDGMDGLPNVINTLYLDVPYEDPVNLTPDDLRQMFGNGACTNATGPCQPTLMAEAWMQAANEGLDGGHCFGIAATAAQVFNRQLPLRAIGSAVRPPYRTPWSSTMTRQIARNAAAQFAIDLTPFALTPKQGVQKLIANLKPGSIPYLIAMYEAGGQGGHAVTPLAVSTTGSGTYDIAIYDNNYPGRTRAIHVDANANTLSYEMFTAPGQPPTMAASDSITLVPVAGLLNTLPCPFCDAADDTTVMLEAVEVAAGESVTATIVGMDGKPVPGLQENDPTSPSTGGMQSFPMFVVPEGVAFQVILSTKGAAQAVETSVTAQYADGSLIADHLTVKPGSVERVSISPADDAIAHRSTGGTDPTLAIVDTDAGKRAYRFEARNLQTAKGESVKLQMAPEAGPEANPGRITITSDSKTADRFVIAATVEDTTGEVDRYAWAQVPHRDERVVVDYSQWSIPQPDALAGAFFGKPKGFILDWNQRVASPGSIGAGFGDTLTEDQVQWMLEDMMVVMTVF